MWWDPHALALDAGTSFGLRRDDLIAKDGDGGGSAQRLAAYRQWESSRVRRIAEGRTPSIASRTVTQIAAERDLPLVDLAEVPIDVVDVPRVIGRPFGPRFGTLVHTTLATVPLDADESIVRRVAATQGRVLLGSGAGVEEEVYAVAEAVMAVLRHPLFDQVRAANAAGRCHRELPLIWQAPDGTLIEGTVDLAFEERGARRNENGAWSCSTSRRIGIGSSRRSAIGGSWRSTAARSRPCRAAPRAAFSCGCDAEMRGFRLPSPRKARDCRQSRGPTSRILPAKAGSYATIGPQHASAHGSRACAFNARPAHAAARPPTRYHATVMIWLGRWSRFGASPSPIRLGSTSAPAPAASPIAMARVHMWVSRPQATSE